ncbi:hypothetical protein AMJ87_10595 [candidate division WOR_3 bacterium SM23_60]|uniref:histidine kinase n=1 Tax=candidate division WOR_3 bacterium SM23_60 TaxID=1703780 RepID=A0A0S8G9Z0_UNCW3|nr:MAG: hypothetical protein AMJ87_10595 [candidate division WOR_3 bacterium SM23_60]
MQDLSLHILDIVENSIAAGATMIKITVNEDSRENLLTVIIHDNGSGLDEESLKKVLDPFYTTKESKRIGLGVSMLAHATREANGTFDIQSKKGEGTEISATFVYNHIDRKPLGNIVDTIVSLIATAGSRFDLVYKHRKNKKSFVLDTKEVKQDLNGIALSNPEVLDRLRKEISKALEEIKAGP